MRKLISHLKNNYGKWGWFGQRAHDAVGINSVLPLNFIICCDYGKELKYFLKNEKKKIISLEKTDNRRLCWGNEDLNNVFKGESRAELIQLLDYSNDDLNFICYRSIKGLEILKQKFPDKIRIFAIPEKLKKQLDNKICFREHLSKMNLETIPGEVTNLERSKFEELREKFGLPFIVQFPYGSSGFNTHKITNKKEYLKLCKKNTGEKVNVLEFINGYSVNINALIVKCSNIEVYITHPSVQLIGLSECSSFPTAFCGNDYSAGKTIDNAILNEIENITKTVGKWIAGKGYLGIFGIDMIVDKKNGKVYPLEINPRFQNSTGLLTMLESISNINYPNLFLLHIIEFLKDKDGCLQDFSNNFNYEDINRALEGAQIVLHNKNKDAIVNGKLKPGIYEYVRNRLIFKRYGISLSDCKKDGEFLISCGIPFKGQFILSQAPICKIQTRDRVLSSNYNNLNNLMSKVVKKTYKKLDLKTV